MVGIGIVLEALVTGFAVSVFTVFGRGALRAWTAGRRGISLAMAVASTAGAVGMVFTIILDGWPVALIGVMMGVLMAITAMREIGRIPA